MNKTVSQKIARIFEIAGYLWLVPSAFLLFYSLVIPLYSILLIASGYLVGFVFLLIGAIPFVLFSLGVFLLVEYRRHRRGRLDEEKILPLWFGTLGFNLVFLLPSLYSFFTTLMTEDNPYSFSETIDFSEGMLLLLLFWSATAVLLSGAAIISEIKNQKYR